MVLALEALLTLSSTDMTISGSTEGNTMAIEDTVSFTVELRGVTGMNVTVTSKLEFVGAVATVRYSNNNSASEQLV